MLNAKNREAIDLTIKKAKQMSADIIIELDENITLRCWADRLDIGSDIFFVDTSPYFLMDIKQISIVDYDRSNEQKGE